MSKKNLAVIFGGISVEHDISIITGVQCANALKSEKYNIFPIYINKEGSWLYSKDFFDIKSFKNEIVTKKVLVLNFSTFDKTLYYKNNKKQKKIMKIDFAFLATHGSLGENGSIQGYLDMCGVSYSSSNVLGSALCMNKLITKQILKENDINVTKFVCITENDRQKGQRFCIEKTNQLSFPLIVKPCSLGSSIGVNFCKNKQSLKNAIDFAFLFDTSVLVEEAVENLIELNLSIMGNSFVCEKSDIEEVILKKDFLTFENKYINDNMSSNGPENVQRIVPAKIDFDLENKILEYGEKAFFALNCKGIVRIDFLIDNVTKTVFLNEINTIPGSLANYLWKTKKYSFFDLLEKSMAYCFDDVNIKDKKIKNFSSNVLSQFKGQKTFLKK